MKETKNDFIIINPSTSEEFDKYYKLRWEILRAPWNYPQIIEKDDIDSTTYHLLVLNTSKEAVACGRILFLSQQEAQIRSMAVAEKFHGIGLGKMVISELENKARKEGVKNIFLQARESAVPFYLACGYSLGEKTHLLFNEIQHYRMDKTLDE